MKRITIVRLVLAFAAVTSLAAAQVPKPSPVLSTEVSRPASGRTTRLSLRVQLPKEVHVQSDRPRDPLLVPTALTLAPPAGVTVARVTYPVPSDLAQPGRPTPLAVFSDAFVIDVDVTVDTPGPVTIPGQLRYQACTDKVCFAPAKAAVEWEISVSDR
jgi:DsbC/DsbD-like thiol-disulfide interchange protein